MIVTALVNLRLGGRCMAVKFVSMFDAVFPLQKEFQDRYIDHQLPLLCVGKKILPKIVKALLRY